MNQQNIPTQRPPRPKPNGYVGRPIRLPKKCAPPKGLVIVTTVTGVLLVISLMILSIALLVGPTEQVVVDGGGGGARQEQSDSPNKPTGNNKPSGIPQKTSIQLPCTTSGSISLSFTNVKNVSADDGIESLATALIDVTNGLAVAGKNGSEKIYPASMTKVMTLLVACEQASDPTALLTVTEEMNRKYRAEGNDGSVLYGWTAGDQITVEDALYLLIYESDTYACWLLAEHIAGSEAEFVKLMNNRAQAMGISVTTHFENSTGLHHENHYTTCFDMAIIMGTAMKNATAKTILTATNLYSVTVYRNGVETDNKGMWSGWYNRLKDYPYGAAGLQYAGNGSDILIIAGKTGHTDVAKTCLVTAGENDITGTLFVCVQAGAVKIDDKNPAAKVSTYDVREMYQKFAKY